MSIAEKEGWRSKGTNPCTHFEKPTEKPRSRVLGPVEYLALEKALFAMESASEAMKSAALKRKETQGSVPGGVKGEKQPDCLNLQVADLIRFLALSGLRKSEALGLRFQDVDLERGIMRFEEHKTSVQSGTKVLPLNSHLRSIIHGEPRARAGTGAVMIAALVATVAGIRHVLGMARRPLAAPAEPWAAFVQGRVLDGRRDALGAFHCNLVAAQGGLPVAAALTWLAYRVGGSVHADPIAAHGWARQATALGWPEGALEPGDGIGGHQQEPGGRPW